MPQKTDLSQLLKDSGVSAEAWAECLAEHKKTSVSLVRIATSKGLISEDILLTVLSRHLDIPYIKINPEDIDNELARKIPSRLVTHYNFMPIKLEGAKIKIAVNDPLEIAALDEIRLFLSQEVVPVIAASKDILESIKQFYGVGAETLEAMAVQAPVDLTLLNPLDDKDIRNESIDPSVIKFLNQEVKSLKGNVECSNELSDKRFRQVEDSLAKAERMIAGPMIVNADSSAEC